jgi:DNA-binding NarL/FixJ family response regulator
VASSTRILIVDDCEAWRRMVRTMFQECSDWQIICEASDGLEAVQKRKELQPDLILLDIGLPRLNGIEAARQICAIAPRSKILFLSAILYSDVMQAAFCAGAQGYVLKSDAAHDLLPAVEAVIEGKRFVCSRFAFCDPIRPGSDPYGPSHLHLGRPRRKADRPTND